MRRLRSYLLLTLVFGVLAGWAAAIDSGRLFDTWAFFKDTETDTGNTITATVLVAPTLVSATATTPTALGVITLAWTTVPGDPATQISVFRAPGACSAPGTFVAIATVLKTATPYGDSGLAAGTYCYKIQGVLLNWTSPFSGTKDATINPPATVRTLKLNSPTSTTNTLASTATGSRDIPGDTATAPFVVWSSAAPVTITASQSWTLALNFNTSNPWQSATLSADLWLTNGSCGTTPTGTTLASAASTSFTADGSLTLVASPFTAPVGPGTLCLKISNTTFDNGASHVAHIITDGTTTLSGAFDP